MRRVSIVLALTLVYMAAEVVGGLISGSLALLADAGHMLSDAGALALSLFALWISRRPPDADRTFGYARVEILAALAHGAALVLIAGSVLVEALGRIAEPPAVIGSVALAVAAGGLVVNGIGMVLLHAGQADSLNVRGAFLHVLADALGSVAAIASATAIWAFDARWADPAASITIAILVVLSALPLVRQALRILMEGAPRHIDVAEVKTALGAVAGVSDVHDLHVWSISEGLECLSGHVVVAPGRDHQALLAELRGVLGERFGVEHVTLQLEESACPPHSVCS